MTTTTLSMALCKGSSWLHAQGERPPSSVKISHAPIAASAQQVSLVQHCGNAVESPALGVAVTRGFGKLTSTTSNFYIHHQREENTTLYCESERKSKNSRSKDLESSLKRSDFSLARDAELWLLSRQCHDAARVIISGELQWCCSIKEFMNLKRSKTIPTTPMPVSNGERMRKWQVGVGVGEDMPAKYQDDDPLKQIPQRRCGILLHPTSLPGPHGIGDLGKDAYKFLDWLKETGCTIWQVLPLVPPGRRGGEDGSPYAGADANCGNTLLISLECLVKDGLLENSDLPKRVPVKRMNPSKVAAVKDPLVSKAAAKLVSMRSGKLKEEMDAFRRDPKIASWVEEAALFAAIDQSTKATTWWTWPSHLRDRDPNAMKAARSEHKGFIDVFVAAQFLFQRQWQALHKYANEAGIQILGDMPIYVGGHSADVWAHRSLFDLDPKTGAPLTVSGVPPDGFSATGQLWGSPLYNWKEMAKDKYSWWATRMLRAYELFDGFRIDHFRGFAAYWAIPATAQSAISGKWKAGPGKAFFTAMKEAVGKRIDIVAEDLGLITTDVVALRRELHAPGMAVMQFAYGGENNARNPHLLHNHEFDQVVYPGTHDNDTCVGWWKKATEDEKERAKKYLRFRKDADVHWEFIRGAAASVARTAIIPMQDVMGLDNDARMNIPATQAGNWGWRVGESDVFEKLEKEKKRLRKLLCRYHRLTPEFREKCKAEKLKSKRAESSNKDNNKDAASSIASSMAKSIGKSFESWTGMKFVGEGDDKAATDKAKAAADKAKDTAKDTADKAKDAPSTFERLTEKLKEKTSKPFEKLIVKAPEKPKDGNASPNPSPKPNPSLNPSPKPNHSPNPNTSPKLNPKPNPKEKSKESGKDKGKDNPKKK